MPTIVVLHTVLSSPDPLQRSVLERIVAAADAVVTMTDTARQRLTAGYRVDAAQDLGDPARRGQPHQRAARPARRAAPAHLGPARPGQGHRVGAARARRAARTCDPTPIYTVAGRTHPKVLEQHGDVYRDSLKTLGRRPRRRRRGPLGGRLPGPGRAEPADPVGRRGGAAVRLDRAGHLGRADRGGRRRGAGGGDRVPARRRAARRRPGPARAAPGPGGDGRRDPARAGRPELASRLDRPDRRPDAALAGGGRPVPGRWPPGCSPTAAPADAAAERARHERADAAAGTAAGPPGRRSRHRTGRTSPACPTTPACSSTPATRSSGASTATASTTCPAACWSPAGSRSRPPGWSALAERYLAFLTHAQGPDGAFRNRLGYDRRWLDEPSTGDWWGRALWGLGTAAARSTVPWIRREALRRVPARRAAALAVAAGDGVRRAGRGRGAARRPARPRRPPSCSADAATVIGAARRRPGLGRGRSRS